MPNLSKDRSQNNAGVIWTPLIIQLDLMKRQASLCDNEKRSLSMPTRLITTLSYWFTRIIKPRDYLILYKVLCQNGWNERKQICCQCGDPPYIWGFLTEQRFMEDGERTSSITGVRLLSPLPGRPSLIKYRERRHNNTHAGGILLPVS